MNITGTNVNSLPKNEIGRVTSNTQNREDEDCYIVPPENISSALKGRSWRYSTHASKPQQRHITNERPKNSIPNDDKRWQSSTFMNIPNKCMTKFLAREKYKQSVNWEQKSNTTQNPNNEHIQKQSIQENQSEVRGVISFFRQGRDNNRSKVAYN